MTDNLFREINEEMRQDRFRALWQKYGRFLIGGTIALVVAVAGNVGWSEYSRQQALESGAQYQVAASLLEQGNEEVARAAFASLGQDSTEGYAILARLHEAALVSAKRDAEGAILLYREIAEDADVPMAFRDLAHVLGALRRIDREDPEKLVAELAPLSAVDSPWRHSTLEITALVAIRMGERAKARKIYESLAGDDTAPESLRQRAGEMVTALGEKS